MTKAELVEKIASQTGIEEDLVLQMVESFMKITRESLAGGENIYLRGFGSFILKKRAKKMGRNITQNTFVSIPEHFVPAFKPVKSFVNRVRIKRKDAGRGVEPKEHLKKSTGSSSSKGKTKMTDSSNFAGKIWNDLRTSFFPKQ